MEEFLFSDPYLSTEQQIAVAGESTLKLSDFYAGPGIIGGQAETTSYEVVHNLFIDPLRVYETNGIVQVIKDLMSGKIDYMVTERVIIATFAQEYPLKVIGSISTGEEYAIIFRKDNVSLQKMINASLKKLLNSPDWNIIKYKYYMDPSY
jgi:polar amino acid transport system substrate-binding protein